MELKKLAPWNWFKNEEESDHIVPIKHSEKGSLYTAPQYAPMLQLHRDIDRYFDHFFRDFNLSVLGGSQSFMPLVESGFFRPKVDLSAAEQEYVLTVEIPGVNEHDVTVDVSGNTMTIKGEKKLEKEESKSDYYRMERSYGSFQRVLSLPEDVDQDGIKAGFKNGILTVTMPRKSMPKGESKQIQITPQE
jgi:HSP20 family protein